MTPFFSVGTYKAFTALGIILTIVCAVAFYFAFLKVQNFRVEQKQLGNDQDAKDEAPPLTKSNMMQLHGITMLFVVGFFLMGLFFVTFTTTWTFFVGLVMVVGTSFYNRNTYGILDWKRGRPMMDVVGVMACIFFLYASMSFANTSIRMQQYAHYTYKGSMAVVDVDSYYNDLFYYGEQAYCPVEMIMTEIKVGWTCPEIECTASVETSFCNSLVCTATDTTCELDCSDDEEAAAYDESQECFERNYNETITSLNSNNGDDDAQNGENEDDWSYEMMYGDCDSCTAEFSDVVDAARAGTNAYGYGTSIFFVVGGTIAGAAWAITKYVIDSREKGDRSTGLMSNEAAVVT